MKAKENKIPDCSNCIKKRVALLPENYIIYSIIEKYGSAFMDSMGGINLSSIMEAVKISNIPEENYSIACQMIVAFYKAGREANNPETNNGQ